MFFIMKTTVSNAFLGYEIVDYLDVNQFRIDQQYENRIITDVTQKEYPEFEIVVVILTLTDKEDNRDIH